jgi:Arc/MetJ-type ribon-helix-helix transcriptional regulator
METLAEQMMDQMRADLVESGDYESYGEEGIRIAVYEDLKDTLKHIFSDVAYE